jgi:acetoin utilization deacetylase AcuC-like enzyme
MTLEITVSEDNRSVRLFYADHYVLPLPAGHRFPMEKYARLRERVLSENVATAGQLRAPRAATEEELCRAHDPRYVRRVSDGELTPAEIRRIGFPWSREMVERSRRSAGATLEASRAALEEGVAVNLAGGTHHAFADRGEGYCVFNDSAIAARAMQAEGRVDRVLVVDCDVHQGNGTASIFADDPTVFTFSIHGAKNFPFRKERSDLDVELPDGVEDEAYLSHLAPALAQAISHCRPDLAIYVSGADPYAGDRLGRLSLSRDGLAERDRVVFAALRGAGIPVAVTMAGGYARDVEDTVSIHLRTVCVAAEFARG